MSWWPFSENNENRVKTASPYDTFVPPPPNGPFIPPPIKPRNLNVAISDKPFTGFSPPPQIKDSYRVNSDYSAYQDEDADSKSKWTRLSNLGTNPRVRGCVENVKMGCKMGAAVGGIFGSLTGLYASIVHRNFLSLPLSAMGGAVSFGFFLGCGMIVRC